MRVKNRESQKYILHCTRCFRRREFTRMVRSGWEIFTCHFCGAVQRYRLVDSPFVERDE